MKKKLDVVPSVRPSREEAERAVRTLIEYIGEAPAREGLRETPQRVVKAFDEYFHGYALDAAEVLSKTFRDVGSYDGPVLVKNIAVESRCEHHLAPFIGHAHIAYVPDGRVVGLSKLSRLVDVYASRLQTQERLTAEIAAALEKHLKPRGVAVLVEAEHFCMKLRGVGEAHALTVTTRFGGLYKKDAALREDFLKMTKA
ncbi:MAG: GTP cyclohydrolase I FolE [Alphaproteobacteria bacterium]|nr:GTP cyclohydrolase I FolE [Alphaproteobacteria bacterium]MDE2337422.1 GTP cyclohydrolase I FolE [Alphaproteobacteria bacterium]